MAERSNASTDGETEDAPTTSTPLLDSTYQRRRKRRVENYLAGTGRAVFRIDGDLQRSLSSNESSILSEEGVPLEATAKRQKRAMECSRGCPAVLQNLVKTYESVGRHCWPIRMYRQNAYSSPADVHSKENYRNIMGE